MTTDTDHILKLAEIIREVDGNHRLGAAALAEAILSHPASRWNPAVEPKPEELTDDPLGDLIDEWVQEAFRKKPYGCKHPTHTYVACKAFEHGRNHAARTALAQPEPKGPTDDELNTMLYYEFTTSTGHGERSDPIGFARAVLARWGRNTTTEDN